jgi:hypothetical protein
MLKGCCVVRGFRSFQPSLCDPFSFSGGEAVAIEATLLFGITRIGFQERKGEFTITCAIAFLAGSVRLGFKD